MKNVCKSDHLDARKFHKNFQTLDVQKTWKDKRVSRDQKMIGRTFMADKILKSV